MKAFIVDRYGKASGRLGQMPEPELRPDDVLVEIHAAGVQLAKHLGAFEKALQDYDAVLNSLDAHTLRKSLNVLKPGGKLISISGPPDPEFAHEMGLNWGVKQVTRLLSYRIRKAAKRRRVSYSFLFMKASGDQLRQIGTLVDAGALRPVVDRVYPIESIEEALAHVESGRAQGKVVVRLR